jgi:hypothetical protein
MLDYAANGVVYWPIEQLVAEFTAECEAKNLSPEDAIRECLGPDVEPEELWQKVSLNLGAGRIRMMFIADRIPAELRRIVEFLNQQMDPAEVLALELRQFAGGSLKTIVPVVYGQTEGAQQKKAAGRGAAGTLAALRAHRTRWQQKFDAADNDADREEAARKLREYDDRIANQG